VDVAGEALERFRSRLVALHADARAAPGVAADGAHAWMANMQDRSDEGVKRRREAANLACDPRWERFTMWRDAAVEDYTKPVPVTPTKRRFAEGAAEHATVAFGTWVPPAHAVKPEAGLPVGQSTSSQYGAAGEHEPVAPTGVSVALLDATLCADATKVRTLAEALRESRLHARHDPLKACMNAITLPSVDESCLAPVSAAGYGKAEAAVRAASAKADTDADGEKPLGSFVCLLQLLALSGAAGTFFAEGVAMYERLVAWLKQEAGFDVREVSAVYVEFYGALTGRSATATVLNKPIEDLVRATSVMHEASGVTFHLFRHHQGGTWEGWLADPSVRDKGIGGALVTARLVDVMRRHPDGSHGPSMEALRVADADDCVAAAQEYGSRGLDCAIKQGYAAPGTTDDDLLLDIPKYDHAVRRLVATEAAPDAARTTAGDLGSVFGFGTDRTLHRPTSEMNEAQRVEAEHEVRRMLQPMEDAIAAGLHTVGDKANAFRQKPETTAKALVTADSSFGVFPPSAATEQVDGEDLKSTLINDGGDVSATATGLAPACGLAGAARRRLADSVLKNAWRPVDDSLRIVDAHALKPNGRYKPDVLKPLAAAMSRTHGVEAATLKVMLSLYKHKTLVPFDYVLGAGNRKRLQQAIDADRDVEFGEDMTLKVWENLRAMPFSHVSLFRVPFDVFRACGSVHTIVEIASGLQVCVVARGYHPCMLCMSPNKVPMATKHGMLGFAEGVRGLRAAAHGPDELADFLLTDEPSDLTAAALAVVCNHGGRVMTPPLLLLGEATREQMATEDEADAARVAAWAKKGSARGGAVNKEAAEKLADDFEAKCGAIDAAASAEDAERPMAAVRKAWATMRAPGQSALVAAKACKLYASCKAALKKYDGTKDVLEELHEASEAQRARGEELGSKHGSKGGSKAGRTSAVAGGDLINAFERALAEYDMTTSEQTLAALRGACSALVSAPTRTLRTVSADVIEEWTRKLDPHNGGAGVGDVLASLRGIQENRARLARKGRDTVLDSRGRGVVDFVVADAHRFETLRSLVTDGVVSVVACRVTAGAAAEVYGVASVGLSYPNGVLSLDVAGLHISCALGGNADTVTRRVARKVWNAALATGRSPDDLADWRIRVLSREAAAAAFDADESPAAESAAGSHDAFKDAAGARVVTMLASDAADFVEVHAPLLDGEVPLEEAFAPSSLTRGRYLVMVGNVAVFVDDVQQAGIVADVRLRLRGYDATRPEAMAAARALRSSWQQIATLLGSSVSLEAGAALANAIAFKAASEQAHEAPRAGGRGRSAASAAVMQAAAATQQYRGVRARLYDAGEEAWRKLLASELAKRELERTTAASARKHAAAEHASAVEELRGADAAALAKADADAIAARVGDVAGTDGGDERGPIAGGDVVPGPAAAVTVEAARAELEAATSRNTVASGAHAHSVTYAASAQARVESCVALAGALIDAATGARGRGQVVEATLRELEPLLQAGDFVGYVPLDAVAHEVRELEAERDVAVTDAEAFEAERGVADAAATTARDSLVLAERLERERLKACESARAAQSEAARVLAEARVAAHASAEEDTDGELDVEEPSAKRSKARRGNGEGGDDFEMGGFDDGEGGGGGEDAIAGNAGGDGEGGEVAAAGGASNGRVARGGAGGGAAEGGRGAFDSVARKARGGGIILADVPDKKLAMTNDRLRFVHITCSVAKELWPKWGDATSEERAEAESCCVHALAAMRGADYSRWARRCNKHVTTREITAGRREIAERLLIDARNRGSKARATDMDKLYEMAPAVGQGTLRGVIDKLTRAQLRVAKKRRNRS